MVNKQEEEFEQTLINRRYDEAQKWLSKVDINSKDAQGNTFIIRACLSSDLERIKWLSQNGGNLDVQDENGKCLLVLTVQAGSLEIVKWLINKKSQALYTVYNIQSALVAAVNGNKIDIVKVLVKAGADMDIQSQDGKTALDLASEHQRVDILKWLLTYKSFNILDEKSFEQGKIIKLDSYFNKYGYEYLNSEFDDGYTIAEYAATLQQTEILKWLKTKNIKVDETLLSTTNSNEPKLTYNLLLLGETGVGKSTFINAFMNYLNFLSLDEAEDADSIHSLIPSNFTITDDQFKPRLIRFGEDPNESLVPGASATQAARSYIFEAGNITVRLIDTPGIGDTRGIDKDEENFDKLLTIIGELQYIHGICILLKPNNAKLTVLFEYCIKQLLSRLQKDASQNIMFVFTNSRSTFYRPGDTITPLQVVLDDIKSKPPHIEIPFDKRNVFCMDNEAFRFLIAKRDKIYFDDDEKENFSRSWTKSAKVSAQLIDYLRSLKPHKIQDTVSLNEARRVILRLSVPLAEMAQNIQDNIQRIDRYKENLSDKTKTIDDLKKYLMVPRIGLTVNKLSYPMTVCTNQKCTEAVKIEDTSKINYKQKCHDHCYLSGVPREVIGDVKLMDCWAMCNKNGTRMCHHSTCGHSYLEHMHIYYTTTPYNYTEEDQNVVKNINKNKVDMEDIEKKIKELTTRSDEYKKEMDIIQQSMAKFAHFLKNNAITPFNDTYRKYIEYLIDREKKMDNGGDKKRLENYDKLILTYENHKAVLDKQLSNVTESNSQAVVSADEVMKTVQNLYKLPLSGKTIKDFFAAQEDAVSAEILRSTERHIKPRKNKGRVVNWLFGSGKNSFNRK